MTSSSRSKAEAPLDAAFLKIALAPHREALLAALRKTAFVASTHLELEVTGVPGVEKVALFAWPEPLGKTRRIAVDVVRLDAAALSAAIQFTYELKPEERPVVEDELPPVTVRTVDAEHIALMDKACWPPDRPRTLKLPGPEGPLTWQLVEMPAQEKEVQQLGKDGMPVFAMVDTATYCYRLTCPRCGRVRYSKPNSIHQIFLCRVCMRMDRLRRRALEQYKARHGKKRVRA